MDGPLVDPSSKLKKVLGIIDLVTTIIFIFEAAFKIVALGLIVNGPWSYFRKTYNCMDFSIILLSVISLLPDSDKLNSIKMLRVFRALRLISKNDGLKVAASALFRAIPHVLNVAVIMVMFFFISGTICVSFFKGKLYECFNDSMSLEVGAIESKWDCLNGGGEWIN